MDDDTFRTVARNGTAEIKEKGSRFVGEAIPVQSTDDIAAQLGAIRRREHAASHHCFAWLLGSPVATEFKYSDDGEPHGSAGKPIYDVIAGRNLTNCLVVVTRYFGGTKLGTGGLVRAYGGTADAALSNASIATVTLEERWHIDLPFTLHDRVVRLVQDHGARLDSPTYAEVVRATVVVRRRDAARVIRAIREISHGRVEPVRVD